MTPDEAFTAFKTAETDLNAKTDTQKSAQATFDSSQTALTQANSDLATSKAAIKTAADNVIAAFQSFEGTL